VVQAALPWQAKLGVVLQIVASLNIFVGVFNLLPLLPLDGGHLAIVIFERLRAWFNRLRGRPDPGLVDIKRLVPVSLLVFAVLVGFGTLLIAADIFNPVHLQV
jgi:membrane-associated protease RseP (regulator of RpoE activity)